MDLEIFFAIIPIHVADLGCHLCRESDVGLVRQTTIAESLDN
jgi:hypothetical protein